MDRLFAEGECGVVYRGLVDDRRTTDHAWIETTAVHFHAPPDLADELELSVSDVNEVSGVTGVNWCTMWIRSKRSTRLTRSGSTLLSPTSKSPRALLPDPPTRTPA